MECKIIVIQLCLFVMYYMSQADLADCKLQEKGSMSESNTEKRHDRKQFDRVYKNSGKTKNNNQYHIRPKLLKEGAKKPFYHKYKTDGPMNMDRQDHVRLLKLPKKDNEKPFVHISKAVNPKKSHANFRPKLQKSKLHKSATQNLVNLVKPKSADRETKVTGTKEVGRYNGFQLSNKKDKLDYDTKRRRKNHLRPKHKFATKSQPKSIYKENKFIGRKKEGHYTEVKEFVKSKRPLSDTESQLGESKALLKEIMKTNKRLKNQNKRLKRVRTAEKPKY